MGDSNHPLFHDRLTLDPPCVPSPDKRDYRNVGMIRSGSQNTCVQPAPLTAPGNRTKFASAKRREQYPTPPIAGWIHFHPAIFDFNCSIRAVDRERKPMPDKPKPFEGVRCKTCSTIIPFQEILDSAPQRLAWEGSSITSLTFTCKKCGKTYTYTGADLELFSP